MNIYKNINNSDFMSKKYIFCGTFVWVLYDAYKYRFIDIRDFSFEMKIQDSGRHVSLSLFVVFVIFSTSLCA